MEVDSSPCESGRDRVCIYSPHREVPCVLQVLYGEASLKLEVGDPVQATQLSIVGYIPGPDQVFVCHGHCSQLALCGPGACLLQVQVQLQCDQVIIDLLAEWWGEAPLYVADLQAEPGRLAAAIVVGYLISSLHCKDFLDAVSCVPLGHGGVNVVASSVVRLYRSCFPSCLIGGSWKGPGGVE